MVYMVISMLLPIPLPPHMLYIVMQALRLE